MSNGSNITDPSQKLPVKLECYCCGEEKEVTEFRFIDFNNKKKCKCLKCVMVEMGQDYSDNGFND